MTTPGDVDTEIRLPRFRVNGASERNNSQRHPIMPEKFEPRGGSEILLSLGAGISDGLGSTVH